MQSGNARRIASNWLAISIGLVLVSAIVAVTVQVMRRPSRTVPRVVIGKTDAVYYSRLATAEDAEALGRSLQNVGFFQDRGTSVLLSKNKRVATISFVVNDGAWNHADTVASFEEIGRRIAPSVGGFPIEIRLVDGEWPVQKSLEAGKTMAGSKDVIYYFGSATKDDADALARALREAGYLEDHGVSVVLSKDAVAAVGFVVSDGVWERPEVVAGFANLARRVAPAAGGLPVQMRLLSAQMETKKEVAVR